MALFSDCHQMYNSAEEMISTDAQLDWQEIAAHFEKYFSTTAQHSTAQHSKQDGSGNPPESARSQRKIRTKTAAVQSCKLRDLIAKRLLCIFEEYFSITAQSKLDSSGNSPENAKTQREIKGKGATAQSCKPPILIAKILLCILK